jgi:hypothetical protein
MQCTCLPTLLHLTSCARELGGQHWCCLAAPLTVAKLPNACIPLMRLRLIAHAAAAAAGAGRLSVPVACCVTGSSYAKAAAANSPTCFQHFKPGSTAAQCSKPVNASGFLNRGPGSATLFLAQSANSCSDSIAVGNVTVSCPDGDSAKKLRFAIQTPAGNR